MGSKNEHGKKILEGVATLQRYAHYSVIIALRLFLVRLNDYSVIISVYISAAIVLHFAYHSVLNVS